MMPDREKVNKGLEICVDRVPGKYTCNECPYEIDGNDCEINLAKDALDLIKELNKTIDNLLSQIGKQAGMQEGRNSTEQKSMENVIHLYDNYYVGTCPACGKGFSTNGGTAVFCKFCGQAVKWNV